MTDQTTTQTQGQQTGQPVMQTPSSGVNMPEAIATPETIATDLPPVVSEDIPVSIPTEPIDPLQQIQEIATPEVQPLQEDWTPSFIASQESVTETIPTEPVPSREPEIAPEEIHEDNIPSSAEISQDVPLSDEELQNLQQQSSIQQIQVTDTLDTKLQSDVQKKFGELFFTTKKIYELKKSIGVEEDEVHIVWADNDRIGIEYTLLLDEISNPMVSIIKKEQQKETEEETINQLKWTYNEESSSLEVMINDTILFNEQEDLLEDPKNKMQVIDKMNKFIFLASEELRKIEKIIKDKEEEEKERRSLQEIFRNF